METKVSDLCIEISEHDYKTETVSDLLRYFDEQCDDDIFDEAFLATAYYLAHIEQLRFIGVKDGKAHLSEDTSWADSLMDIDAYLKSFPRD